MSTISPVHLLKLFTIRENYELYYKYIQQDVLDRDAVLVLKDFGKYFEKYQEDGEIDLDKFLVYFQTELHEVGLNQEQHNNFLVMFNRIKTIEYIDAEKCLPTFFAAETREVIQKHLHPLEPAKIRDSLEEYERKLGVVNNSADPDIYGIEQVNFKDLNKAEGITWCLDGMQQSLGCLIKGDFIVLGAGVNVGKSALCVTQAAHTYKYLFKNKLSSPILYFNTEGTLDTVWARFLMALFKKKLNYGLDDLITNQKEVLELYRSYNDSLFVGFDAAGKDWRYIASKMEQLKPALVIIDMLDDLKPETKSDDTRADKGLYARMRWLSNKYCPVLATCQAKASGKYYDSESHMYKSKHWLELNELDWSNVGKQAKAESVVLIGCDDNFPNDRYINVAKVKRGKAGRLPVVQFNNKFATYEDMEDIKL